MEEYAALGICVILGGLDSGMSGYLVRKLSLKLNFLIRRCKEKSGSFVSR